MSEESGQERRVSNQLEKFWNELRGDQEIPFERDLDISELEELWPYCFIIEITAKDDGETNYMYSYIGESIIEAYGDDLTGKSVYAHLIAPYTEDLLQKFGEVSTTKKPIADDSEFVNLQGALIRYRQGLVPFAYPDGSVGYILGAMKWRSYNVFGREDGKRFVSGKAIHEDDFQGAPKKVEDSDFAEHDFSKIEGMDGDDDAWAEAVLDVIGDEEETQDE
jgi:hypothetical protein